MKEKNINHQFLIHFMPSTQDARKIACINNKWGTVSIYSHLSTTKKSEEKKLLVLILYCNLRPYFLFIYTIYLYTQDMRKKNK